MSGAPFDLNVTISIVSGANDQSRLYQGCGSFTADPRLHNIWALVSIEDRSVDAASYPHGVPTLELNLSTHRLYGFDGCNRFSGSMAIGPAGLRFSALLGTRMACPGEMGLYQLSRLLSNSEVSYSWNVAGNLVISKEGKALAEFRPVD
jgi:heat shock protein HslJ